MPRVIYFDKEFAHLWSGIFRGIARYAHLNDPRSCFTQERETRLNLTELACRTSFVTTLRPCSLFQQYFQHTPM